MISRFQYVIKSILTCICIAQMLIQYLNVFGHPSRVFAHVVVHVVSIRFMQHFLCSGELTSHVLHVVDIFLRPLLLVVWISEMKVILNCEKFTWLNPNDHPWVVTLSNRTQLWCFQDWSSTHPFLFFSGALTFFTTNKNRPNVTISSSVLILKIFHEIFPRNGKKLFTGLKRANLA